VTSNNFRTLDGCTLSYTLHGSGIPGAPRIVLIHSLALDRSIWDGVVGQLAGHADILTYDCRGHGQSDRPHMSYTPELFAGDLTELMDSIGWQSAIVAGCSMGGCVAQAFAAKHPDRALGLGLIDTTAWYGPKAPEQWRERAQAARAKGLASLVDFQATRWFSDAFRAQHADALQALTRVFVANDVECYAATCEMLGTADLRPDLDKLRMPAAVMVGEEDYATPVEMAQQLQQAIAGATLTVIRNARHLSPVEKPAEVAALLLKLWNPRAEG
jgi:3-oxoadipate enol-lactonase